MDHLPPEVLDRVLVYAIPTAVDDVVEKVLAGAASGGGVPSSIVSNGKNCINATSSGEEKPSQPSTSAASEAATAKKPVPSVAPKTSNIACANKSTSSWGHSSASTASRFKLPRLFRHQATNKKPRSLEQWKNGNDDEDAKLDRATKDPDPSLPVRRRFSSRTGLTMAFVADWRCVNHQWRDALDDPSSVVWYQLAKSLGLEPPLQLYAGGTHQDVCKFLLKAELEREGVTMEAANTPRRNYNVACGMMMGPRNYDAHPHPERPMILLPKEMTDRIAANAKGLETFLHCLDFAVFSSSEDWHQSAWNRYRMFLHLKCMNPGVWLVPTADIEFVWLAHIFRTKSYWEDMTRLEVEPDHYLSLSYGEAATYSKAVEATKELWDKTFGPHLPFIPEGSDTSWKIWKIERNVWGDGVAKVARKDPRRFFPCLGPELLDLPRAVECLLPTIQLSAEEIKADLTWFPNLQKAFREINENSYDVMRGRYRDRLVAQQVVPSYERFLNLCFRNNNNGDYAPPYVLDLVWHAHQMEPVKYKEDCFALFGREFWHDPWPHGLGVSTPLAHEFECTWKETYGTPMFDDWKFHLGSPTNDRSFEFFG